MGKNKEIRELKERAVELDEKTKQVMELLEDLKSEFEDLQDTILFNQRRDFPFMRPVNQQNIMKPRKQVQTKEVSKIISFSPIRINMDGSVGENKLLTAGWWPSENNFRWGGQSKKHPEISFEVPLKNPYELNVNMFVPEALTKKPIKIFVNDVEIHSFIVDKERQIKKTIKIPKEVISDNKLKIIFKSDFWKPSDIDPEIEDKRTLSLAFNHVELRET